MDVSEETLISSQISEWQRSVLASSEGETHKKYWHDHIGSEYPILDIPSQFPKATGASEVNFSITHLKAKITQAAKKFHTTTYSILFAAWSVLLWKYSR